MKCYIVQKDPPQDADFTIMQVQDHLIAQFEAQYKGRVLAKGNDTQEAIIAFSQKDNQWEPIDVKSELLDIKSEPMEIKLRNIQVVEGLSHESNAFTASLYINNTRAGVAENNGSGGMTIYTASNTEGQRLITEAEAYCRTLPPKVFEDSTMDGRPLTVKMDLEFFIDNFIEDYLRQKDISRFRKKVELETLTGIAFGTPDKICNILSFDTPLAYIFKYPKVTETLKKRIHEDILPKLAPGEKILNTNIPPDILEKLEIPANQIVEQNRTINKAQAVQDEEQNQKKGRKGRR